MLWLILEKDCGHCFPDITTPRGGCSNPKAPPDAAFFSLFLEDAPLRSVMVSHIPRFFTHPKNEKEREKMATSRGVDRHFRGPGWQKSWRKCKTSGDTTRNQETVTLNNGCILRRTRPLQASPSKDADSEITHSNNFLCIRIEVCLLASSVKVLGCIYRRRRQRSTHSLLEHCNGLKM